jgi:hypothetical protein
MRSVSTSRLVEAIQGKGITFAPEVREAAAVGRLREFTYSDEVRSLVADPENMAGDIACELFSLIASREAREPEPGGPHYQWETGLDAHRRFDVGVMAIAYADEAEDRIALGLDIPF